mgnify:CR=1 FL=1
MSKIEIFANIDFGQKFKFGLNSLKTILNCDPGFKGYVWDTNPVLQMCHQLNLRSTVNGDEAEFELARAFGVAQHHDGISGTERQHVVDDYSKTPFL